MKVNYLRENETGYKVFLYIFYACSFLMLAITAYGVYAMLQEWSARGTYVMGEVLVKTEFPFPHFAKLTTWLFFSTIIGWYCCSRIGWKRTVKLYTWKMALLQIMLLGLTVICLYETLYNFMVLGAQITAGIKNGSMPDIDLLTIAYPDPTRPWNLIFATKMFLAGFLISAHAFYLSTKPRKSVEDINPSI